MATPNLIGVRCLVGVVILFTAYYSACLLTAGNSTATAIAALDLSRRYAEVRAGTLRPVCNVSDPQHQICRRVGDVRTVGAKNTVLYLAPAPPESDGQQLNLNATKRWLIKAQSARYVRDGERVTVEARVVVGRQAGRDAPACTARCPSPAVVFTVARHLRNLWHSFADVLVPLYATAGPFDRRVLLVVTNGRRARWFVGRFRPVLEALSMHEVVDLDTDSEVRCYPQAIVGLRSRGGGFVVDNDNLTLLDFQAFLRSAYSLLPPPARKAKKQQPRLMLVDRHKTRRFVNTPEISAAIRKAGFEQVTVARLTDSCDVLVGAHGAGLTHLVFLRAGSVVIEVVPYGFAAGASTPATTSYRDFFEAAGGGAAAPVHRVRGRRGGEHAAGQVRRGAPGDPEGVYRRGDAEGKPYAFRHYWEEQDIRLNVTRFAAALAAARRQSHMSKLVETARSPISAMVH